MPGRRLPITTAGRRWIMVVPPCGRSVTAVTTRKDARGGFPSAWDRRPAYGGNYRIYTRLAPAGRPAWTNVKARPWVDRPALAAQIDPLGSAHGDRENARHGCPDHQFVWR